MNSRRITEPNPDSQSTPPTAALLPAPAAMLPAPDQPDDPQSVESAQQALRARRLVQIASATIAGLAIVLLRALLDGKLLSAGILALGIGAMLLCLLLNRRKATDMAILLLLLSITAMVAGLLWRGEGLRDSALLVLPSVLIVSALLVRPSRFLQLVLLVLVLSIGIAAATHLGWRQDQGPDPLLNRTMDTVLIMLISAFAVALVIRDQRHNLIQLKVQLARYQQAQESLTYLSQHDALTQLPNRLLGRSRIEQALAHAQRNRRQVALLFVDLDNFKAVNDAYGHTVGDEFLKQVALRLRATVRHSDSVSRQGGDEFLIALTDLAEGEAVTAVAGKLLEAMAEPFALGNTEVSSSCSIGIALYPAHGADFETLLRNADIAAGYAKDAGRNMFRFHEASMNLRLQENLQLVAGLRSALARNEFVLHYQPVVDIATGRMVGAEALIRWNSPEHGLVTPALFIGAAERSGLIVEIGRWVIEQGCRQMVAWRDAGMAPFVLAVNLSPVQFRRGNVEAMLAAILHASGMDPALLELEVTESTLIQDSEKFILSLQRLKALGLRIAIDDFGTGYSNLSYLQRFSIDKLKIDQSFVRRMLEGPQQEAIVSAIIQIASSLNLTTTAEGIEDEPIRQRLAQLGCTQGQGYLFARPMPAQDFVQWLQERGAGTQAQHAGNPDGGPNDQASGR